MSRPNNRPVTRPSGTSNRSNGTNGATANNNNTNLYQQLIESNDLVRELDDIEAISQQISQHAEVLYQNWKNSAPNSPSGEKFPLFKSSNRPSLTRSHSNPYSTIPHSQQNGNSIGESSVGHETSSMSDSSSSNSNYSRLSSSGFPSSLRSNTLSPKSYEHNPNNFDSPRPYSSGLRVYNSDSKSSTLPSTRQSFGTPKSRSITQIGNSNPSDHLELLASPEVNGNLKDLVNNFVNTDRAKQAARQTISDTISSMAKKDSGASNTLKQRAMSPLKSPGALSPNRNIDVAKSNNQQVVVRRSGNSMNPNEKANPFSFSSMPEFPNIHQKMTPIFNSTERSWPSTRASSPALSSSSSSFNRQANTNEVIPIPVQHIGSRPSSSSSVGLKSPTVLQTISGSSTPTSVSPTPSSSVTAFHPRRTSNRNSLEFDMPLPHLYAANVEKMRQRFEEAKQRINSMHKRAMGFGMVPGPEFADVDMVDGLPKLISGFSDDHDNFMGGNVLLGRRLFRKHRPEPPVSSEAPPHPELTPQQKQHINSINQNSQGFPARRLLSGPGSVAERVMLFERCPTLPESSRSPPRNLSPDVSEPVETPIPIKHEPSSDFRRRKLSDELKPALPASSSSATSRMPDSSSSTKILKEIPIMKTGSSMLKDSLSPSPSSPTFSTAAQPTSPKTTSLLSSQLSSPSIDQAQSRSARLINSSLSRPSPLGSMSRFPSKAKEKYIPKFHFPYGNPSKAPRTVDRAVQQIKDQFKVLNKSRINLEDLGKLLKLTSLWVQMCRHNHDEASQFVYLLTRGSRKFLVPEDFVPLIQDIVDTHPGLGFLKEATEFHSRYVHTVIARIFFCVNRSWSGQISINELRKSNFLQVLRILDEEEDINRITDFFSYEHFYVIYCKFWELDKDHDLFIDREDLSKHNDHAISTRMIDRIFSGAVTRGSAQQAGKMSYTEFVWFLIAEEDKRHPTSIEYWFRCMDLDGDGYLSMYELEYFYEEQLQRMEQLGIETLPFEDCLCQMLDMIKPRERIKISLADLKRCSMTPIFFDTFFNLEKYLDHEQRDPFASQRELDEDGNELSDWDRFAAEEYELLVAEEGNADELQDLDYDEASPEGALKRLEEVGFDNEEMMKEP